jgi:hypothetical protein
MEPTHHLDKFLRGLKPKTRMELELNDPQTLIEAIPVLIPPNDRPFGPLHPLALLRIRERCRIYANRCHANQDTLEPKNLHTRGRRTDVAVQHQSLF